MDSFLPCLLIAKELPEEARLPETLPLDWHGAPVGFEEEEGTVPTLQLTFEAKPEDLIRLHAQAMELPALADIDLPAERQTQAPGSLRCQREHLLGRNEPYPLAAPAGDLEGHHNLGDREGVVKENPRDVAVLRIPPYATPPHHTLRLEKLGATVSEGIDEGLGAAGVPIELHGRAIKVAVMEEELQAPERCLPAPS